MVINNTIKSKIILITNITNKTNTTIKILETIHFMIVRIILKEINLIIIIMILILTQILTAVVIILATLNNKLQKK